MATKEISVNAIAALVDTLAAERGEDPRQLELHLAVDGDDWHVYTEMDTPYTWPRGKAHTVDWDDERYATMQEDFEETLEWHTLKRLAPTWEQLCAERRQLLALVEGLRSLVNNDTARYELGTLRDALRAYEQRVGYWYDAECAVARRIARNTAYA